MQHVSQLQGAYRRAYDEGTADNAQERRFCSALVEFRAKRAACLLRFTRTVASFAEVLRFLTSHAINMEERNATVCTRILSPSFGLVTFFFCTLLVDEVAR